MLFLGAFLLAACQPPPVVIVDPLEKETGRIIFSRAIKFDNLADYDNALKQYDQYMSRFPDGPQADAVLFRMGKIYQKRLQHADARKAYRRLMTHFLDSSYFQDAAVEILVTLFEEARYKEVLVEADQVLKKAVSSGRQVRINRLLGDFDFFRGELARYSILLKEKDLERANKILSDAELLLSKAERASHTGDKIMEKKYFSALVDIMDLLAGYDE